MDLPRTTSCLLSQIPMNSVAKAGEWTVLSSLAATSAYLNARAEANYRTCRACSRQAEVFGRASVIPAVLFIATGIRCEMGENCVLGTACLDWIGKVLSSLLGFAEVALRISCLAGIEVFPLRKKQE